MSGRGLSFSMYLITKSIIKLLIFSIITKHWQKKNLGGKYIGTQYVIFCMHETFSN